MQLWVLSLFFLTSAYIQARDLQVSTHNSVICKSESCIYQVQNWSKPIGELIAAAKKRTFSDNFLISDPDISIELHNSSEIYIKFTGPYRERRAEFINHLKDLDVLDPKTRKLIEIKLKVAIYTMESSAVDNFKIGISNMNAAQPHHRPQAQLSVGGTEMLKLAIPVNVLDFATSVLGLNLDMSRLNSSSTKVSTYDFNVTNGNSLGPSITKMRFNPEGSGPSMMEKAPTGFSVGGVVTVDREGTKIGLENFTLKHSVPVDGKNWISKDLVLPRREFEIPLGQAYPLWTEEEDEDTQSDNRNSIFSANDVDRKIRTKKIVVLTATLEGGAGENLPAARSSNPIQRQQFSSDPSKTIQEAFQGIAGYTKPIEAYDDTILFGQKIGFGIDAANISSENSEKMIEIREKNLVTNVETKRFFRLGDLAQGWGYSLQTLKYAEMQKACSKRNANSGCELIPIEIELIEGQGGASLKFTMDFYPRSYTVNLRSLTK